MGPGLGQGLAFDVFHDEDAAAVGLDVGVVDAGDGDGGLGCEEFHGCCFEEAGFGAGFDDDVVVEAEGSRMGA